MTDRYFFSEPPEGDFWVRFDFFWDNGVGNSLNSEGEPVAWTESTLEAALNFKPSAKSIGHWHSRKSLPSKEHIHRMCRILFHADPHERRIWADALISSRRLEELKRMEKKKSRQLTSTNVVTGPLQNVSRTTIAIAATLGILAILLFLWRLDSPQVSISNIRFCSVENFSNQSKKCEISETHFDEDTKKIYVSFETDNIPFGEPFSRKWYRNSEKWLERNDFFDDTWRNYTWIHNNNGHDHGLYSMRIIVGNQVFSGSFTLGDL